MTTRRSQSRSKHQDLGLPSYLDVPPRFGTLRNFNNPTRGTRMGITARLLGQPFMPWQQYVADVIGEVDPRTGFNVYREAYLTCMRQVGKTTFVIVLKATTALDTKQPVRVQFAAQEGKSAIAAMVKHAEIIAGTPLGQMLADGTPTTSNGKEHLRWSNGSTEWPLNDKKSSGHGDTIALGAITEAFAHRDDRYIQTMQPAMKTNPNAQLFVESTQGDAASIYWNEQTDELRKRIQTDPAGMGRVAFFDWSFAPDEDPFSAETWRRRIPSLGHTLRIEEVQHDADNAITPKKVRAFKRSNGNIADLGAGEGSLFSDEAWEASAVDDIIVGMRAFTLDIANDRSWSSIGWAGINRAGQMQSELEKHERSTHWVLPYFGALFDRNPKAPRRVYVVAGGQAALMADKFERAGIEMIVLPKAEYAAAIVEWYDGLTDTDEADQPQPQPTVFHRRADQLPLDVAVGGAAWTKSKPRVWDEGASRVVVSPLVAVSIGPWAYRLEKERATEVDLLKTIA